MIDIVGNYVKGQDPSASAGSSVHYVQEAVHTGKNH
mgnify:CR=1 FL=1